MTDTFTIDPINYYDMLEHNNNKPYNVITDDTMKRFLSSEYFVFFLEAAS